MPGSKLDKAVSLGVPVLDEAALERMLETGEAPAAGEVEQTAPAGE